MPSAFENRAAVANTIQLEAAQIGVLFRRAALSDSRLQPKEPGGRFEIVCDGAWRSRPIGNPPLCCTFKLGQRPRGDLDGVHGPSVLAKPAESFCSRNRLAAKGLGQRLVELL